MGQACIPVLILDQDPVTRNYAARVAENGGYFATEVANPGEAISALEADPQIKAVIAASPWQAGIDGIALAGTVRCFWPKTGIVLLADRVLPSDADLPSGTVVLARPFAPYQLTNAIAEALLTEASAEPLGADFKIELPHLAH